MPLIRQIELVRISISFVVISQTQHQYEIPPVSLFSENLKKRCYNQCINSFKNPLVRISSFKNLLVKSITADIAVLDIFPNDDYTNRLEIYNLYCSFSQFSGLLIYVSFSCLVFMNFNHYWSLDFLSRR